MKNDSEILARRPLLKAWPGEVTRIEPGFGAAFGIPDVLLTGPGFDMGLVEFKYAPSIGSKVIIRSAQRLWWKKNLPFTKRIALVICYPSSFTVLPVSPIAEGKFRPDGYAYNSITSYPYASAPLLPQLLEAAYALN